MSLMQLFHTQKGTLYACDCAKCGATMHTHEWVNDDHNERRDAMAAGTLACDECSVGRADKDTYYKYPKPQYAARYSAPGYMDCTDWSYGPNLRKLLRKLLREVRDVYGQG